MKLLTKTLLSLIVTLLLTTPTFAQDIKLGDLMQPDSEVKAAEIESLDAKEDERLKSFQEQLGFTLPEYTDNASYVITFTDPSPEKVGLQVSIDSANFKAIESPYTFSALAIGNHNFVFKFTDKDGSPQEIEYDMTVLPRYPIIKTPQYMDSKMIISGTGLANSEVLLFVTSGIDEYTLTADVNGEGDWNAAVEAEEGLKEGIYTIVGYTRKYGYASDYSKPIVYQIGETNGVITQDSTDNGISFSFSDLNKDNILEIISENRDLDILVLGAILLGSIVALVLHTLISGTRVNRSLKKAEDSIKNVGQNKEKTLRELFEQGDTPINKDLMKDSKKKDSEKKKEENKEKVVSKEDFLKDFKSIDPDKDNGKENPSKKVKDVKISLTSQKED